MIFNNHHQVTCGSFSYKDSSIRHIVKNTFTGKYSVINQNMQPVQELSGMLNECNSLEEIITKYRDFDNFRISITSNNTNSPTLVAGLG